MIDNQDGIREKDIGCFAGKRHKNKDSLKQFVGNINHAALMAGDDLVSNFMDDLNGEDFDYDKEFDQN